MLETALSESEIRYRYDLVHADAGRRRALEPVATGS